MATAVSSRNNISPEVSSNNLGGAVLSEEERRTELKQLLSSVIPCIIIGIEAAEAEITSIFTLDELNTKRSSCQVLIALSKILKEYPKGAGYIPRPLPSCLSLYPKLREFRSQMDGLIWEVLSKLTILKEFVQNITDSQKLFIVALSVRDAKNCFTQNECEHFIKMDPALSKKMFGSSSSSSSGSSKNGASSDYGEKKRVRLQVSDDGSSDSDASNVTVVSPNTPPQSAAFDSARPKSPDGWLSGLRGSEKSRSNPLLPAGRKGRSQSDPQLTGAEQEQQQVPNPSIDRVNKFYKLQSSTPSTSSNSIPLSLVPSLQQHGDTETAVEWERYDQDRAAQLCCHFIQQIRGFKTDAGSTIKDLPDLAHFVVKDTGNDELFFKEDFLERNHLTFLGVSKGSDKAPIAISVCSYLVVDSGDLELLYIIRTQDGDERLRFILSKTREVSAKDMVKMLKKARPQYQNFNIKEVKDESMLVHLLDFESKNNVQRNFKFGVLYCRDGQTEENEIYANHEPFSKQYQEFLDLLGERVTLKGWKAYRGGLDIREDTTGTHSVYQRWNNRYEIMYHVATMIPYKADDAQQIDRKRHLGNDIVIVIFKEGDTPISPTIFKSNFNHIFAVVQVDKDKTRINGGDTHYNLSICVKDEIMSFGPSYPKYHSFTKSELKSFLLTKLINGERWVLNSPVFAQKFLRTRREFLQSYVNEYFES
ncbi:hypothetical protein SAMD00019534_082930 [Acytostelium subglobosum LB1]|uniref:hypothetical protein n=1 Tax=Acytostelium subglobosum LB1 TaxID=1410327 RepID=UPI000644A323|nr:hypothetical protein SAMD00019534_082930 [Acytostelium subglobosum LB1]GAM25118.1 hypothetical protein SAMD00019534_082930 [Acytostelium subglobosum LB1]|eukprot:XP_012752207.1 hypothetical protein SAMD00019534_082930 [Acytostelium subglobosum LB1]